MRTEIVLSEFEKGIKDIDTCEMGQVIDMLKDIAETKYCMSKSAEM